MPTSLHATDLRLSFTDRVVLGGVDVHAEPGWRIGVIGPNGVGKSTLLGVLAGRIATDAGSVRLVPPSANVGLLPQEPERRSDEAVVGFITRRTGVAAASVELDAATGDLATGTAGADDRYGDAIDRWLALGGADLDARIGTVCAELGIDERILGQPMASLSGGEAARVGLAAVLLSRFDVVLLDEPTNDLDLDGLDRLERWVTSSPAPVVLVSHDRAFLQRTVTHVLELDEFTRTATTFAGGWDAYLTERDVAARHAQERYDEYDAKRSALLARGQREREWATQGMSKAKKRPDDNDKLVRRFRMDQTEQLAARAARTDKMLERLEEVDEPREAWQLRLTFGRAERSGVVVRLDDAQADHGSFRLGPLSLTIDAGERVAIVGSNGSGKSTLLDVILGRRPLDAGTRWFGPGVVVGELEQRRVQLAEHASVLDGFLAATGMTVSDARTLLAKFRIGAGEVHRTTSSLSPGERTRLVLALLMARGTNCLVLDEPTNHLDLPAIEQLEVALDAFDGTVLLVTHDRALLDHVRLTRRLTLAAGRLVADETIG
jgi:ATPase subunit of ABC transporter with duplicated ATPase domains